MRGCVVLGALLLGACQSSSPASPPATVADVPVLRPDPAKEPTFAVEAPVGRPSALINARIQAIRHRLAACLNDAVDRDPLLSGKSEATFAWAAGEITRDREFDGVLSGHEVGACVTDMLEQSASNIITGGGERGVEEGAFEFTLRINFAGPYTAGHPLPPEEQRGEERWSVLSESDDGSLTLSAAAPTEVSREALIRCRIPQKTSVGSEGGWLVGRIDRAGKLILPPADSLQPSDDTPCLRRVLSRATFSPGPVRYFKVHTYPHEALGRTRHDAFVEEMAGLDAQAVAQAAPKPAPAKDGDGAVEFGMHLLPKESPQDRARRIAAETERIQTALWGARGSIGQRPKGSGLSGAGTWDGSDEIPMAFTVPGGTHANAAQGGLGSIGGGEQGLGQVFGPRKGTGNPKLVPKLEATFKVTGGVSTEVAQRIIRQRFGGFRLCYERELALQPTLTFTTETKLLINQAGGLASSTMRLSKLQEEVRPSAQFSECFEKTLSDLSFPVPDNGAATAMMTLSFSPPEIASTAGAPSAPRRSGFDGKPLAELKLSRHFAEAAPLAEGSRLSGLWFVKGTRNQDAPIVAIARGPESQAQTQAQTDCHVRDRGVELRFFARDPANAASACKDFAAKHVRPID